jgi:hypothetical protein
MMRLLSVPAIRLGIRRSPADVNFSASSSPSPLYRRAAQAARNRIRWQSSGVLTDIVVFSGLHLSCFAKMLTTLRRRRETIAENAARNYHYIKDANSAVSAAFEADRPTWTLPQRNEWSNNV